MKLLRKERHVEAKGESKSLADEKKKKSTEAEVARKKLIH